MTDTLTGVDGHLTDTVEPSRGRRDNLTHPVWCLFKVGNVLKNWHAFPTPASEIWNKNVCPEMQFRLKEDPPTARTAGTTKTPIEGINIHPNDGRSACMGRCGPRRGNQLAINDLGDQDIWDLQEVFVRCFASCEVHDSDHIPTAPEGKVSSAGQKRSGTQQAAHQLKDKRASLEA